PVVGLERGEEGRVGLVGRHQARTVVRADDGDLAADVLRHDEEPTGEIGDCLDDVRDLRLVEVELKAALLAGRAAALLRVRLRGTRLRLCGRLSPFRLALP